MSSFFKTICFFLIYILPHRWVSRFVGRLMSIQWPYPISFWSIHLFSMIYKINVQEAEKDLKDYKSINEFFVRRLKSELRPIKDSFIHPVDAKVVGIGSIREGLLYQVKNKSYTLEELLGEEQVDSCFDGGTYVSYYLSPHDYHRVHCPCQLKLNSISYIPGSLFPVNDLFVNSIDKLYVKNKRVIFNLKSDLGRVVVVMIGALNVGRIEVCHARTEFSIQLSQSIKFDFSQPVEVSCGSELGVFHFGSSVVVLFDCHHNIKNLNATVGQSVKLGQSLF